MSFTKKDTILSLIVGFLVGMFMLSVIKNLEIALPINKYLILISFPVLSLAGVYVLYRISLVWQPFIFQFAKFFVVGGLNTFMDLGILNILIYLTNITAGFYFSVFKSISFVVTVINSFFWNKYWTFQKSGNFFLFFLVVLGSFLLNVGIASFMVNVIGHPADISPKVWDNLAALSSLVLVLTWNFLGMKYIVFKKRSIPAP